MSELSGGNVSLISPIDTKKSQGLTRVLVEIPDEQTLLVNSTTETLSRVHAKYVAQEDYASGRCDSIHGVTFANLTISTDRRDLSTQPVAIKPYPRAWMAAHDFRLANQLNSEGKVTFEPLGFTKIDGQVAGLTRFEQGVTSFDNILFDRKNPPDDEQIAWALSSAATTLIHLHSREYTHGDFQVKNTAYDINLQPRVIDLTTMRRQQNYEEDIMTYLESLTRFGLKKSPATADQVDEHFLTPYEESVPDIFNREQASEMKASVQMARYILDDLLGVNDYLKTI